MMIIFVLALLLFGPKKLPELGKTIGKALTEFRRASNDLKSTWDQQMRELERETEEIKRETDVTARAVSEETYSYDYDGSYGYGHGASTAGSTTTADATSTPSASATQGAGASDVKPAGSPVTGSAGTGASAPGSPGTVAHSGLNAAGVPKPVDPVAAENPAPTTGSHA